MTKRTYRIWPLAFPGESGSLHEPNAACGCGHRFYLDPREVVFQNCSGAECDRNSLRMQSWRKEGSHYVIQAECSSCRKIVECTGCRWEVACPACDSTIDYARYHRCLLKNAGLRTRKAKLSQNDHHEVDLGIREALNGGSKNRNADVFDEGYKEGYTDGFREGKEDDREAEEDFEDGFEDDYYDD
jgi:hypothetical protein